ncbi:response regulator [Gayadomonas joobiniege]|uniref:response regulator n=1 Tax=Gayadomonas joobiniege TaxID=1234606 RepID=UPI00036DA8B0|nr:response regulator [Gayadomonas joobiniege]
MDSSTKLAGKKILVVDDDLPLLQFLGEVFNFFGCDVSMAESGQRGLELAAEQPYDLILSDLVMPGELNGAQFANAVLQQKPDTAIIFMSGYVDDKMEINERLSDIPIIQKPFRKRELLTQIDLVLH